MGSINNAQPEEILPGIRLQESNVFALYDVLIIGGTAILDSDESVASFLQMALASLVSAEGDWQAGTVGYKIDRTKKCSIKEHAHNTVVAVLKVRHQLIVIAGTVKLVVG